MQGITLKSGLISYYGNPAGYTEKDAAVVDHIFQTEELTGWLAGRGLTPKWTDGDGAAHGRRAAGSDGKLPHH